MDVDTLKASDEPPTKKRKRRARGGRTKEKEERRKKKKEEMEAELLRTRAAQEMEQARLARVQTTSVRDVDVIELSDDDDDVRIEGMFMK
jgi:hypothetical protein